MTANLAEADISLTAAIQTARDALLAEQHQDGHWCFELEADCTIPAEYILMMHYLDEIDAELEAKIAVYLRQRQIECGGWSLYAGGAADVSCSIKVYFALKLAGDSPDAPWMQRARQFILSAGGAATANVFTRIALALFNQLPWRAVPFIPVEIMLLPRWFPFHLSKVAYWSRTVMVPLLVLCSLKPQAKNPRGVSIGELFTVPPEQEKHYFRVTSRLSRVFLGLDRIGRLIEPLIPNKIRRLAVAKAEQWIIERLNGEDGLGGIFPAMASAYEVLVLLGYGPDHPYCQQARRALKKLLVIRSDLAYCQPCLSPVWDTALSTLALQVEGSQHSQQAVHRALKWLQPLQILDGAADWQEYNPQLKPGGWAFQYRNDYYPDLDDTAVVSWAMYNQQHADYQVVIRRAADWLAGMQSRNGGFAAFDQNNQYYYLNAIPFADHGALLDPPTSDVSARCLMFFSLLRRPEDQALLSRTLEYLLKEQEPNGSWFGRWGTNYIYGSWSVLIALQAAGVEAQHSAIRRAVAWLCNKQNVDGGWGESNTSYHDSQQDGHPSTSYQTAWALLGLMAAGEVHSTEVSRGIEYLLRTQQPDGFWHETSFTAPGFPKVFYLRYHGYCKYFPFWALAQYNQLIRGNN